MNKFMTIVSSGAVVLGLAVSAFAVPNPKFPVARKRQAEQQRRIGQGVKSGELTAGETIKLEKEQRDVNKDIKAARADGVVTSAERHEIRADQNQESKDIYRLKHNSRVRP